MISRRVPRAGLLSLAVVLAVSAGPATAQVVKKRSMPTPRLSAAAAVLGGKIYVLGGISKQGKAVATVEAYDPATDTWTSRSRMPTARAMLAAVTCGGTIYALGGRSGQVLAAVEAYDAGNDRWRAVRDLPSRRWGLMAACVAGKVLAIGGIAGTGAARRALASVEAFDPATSTWTTAGSGLPVALQSAGTAQDNERIFLAGGRVGAGNTGAATDAVLEWRAGPNAWTKAPPLAERRTGAAASIVGSYLVVAGGSSSGGALRSIEVMHLVQQKWVPHGLTLSAPRTGAVAASVNGRAYVIGGATESSVAGITGLVEQIAIE
jgi:N-acetylneuraminic acid mutarotase